MKILSLMLCLCLLLSGCGWEKTEITSASAPDSANASPTAITEAAPQTETSSPAEESSVFSSRDLDVSFSQAECIVITLGGNSISCSSDAVEISGTTAAIRKGGTYLLSGTLTDGSIVVDVEKNEKVQLVFDGVSIHNGDGAAIYVRQADKVFLTLAEGSKNTLSGGEGFEPDGDTNIDAVVFSRDDLTLNGSGALTVTSPGGHGIVSKDSLRITGGSYTIDAASHGLSGKDEVSIAGGSFDILAGKDGIHAENSEDANAGTVYLENGTYRITAGGDGISASGDCRIADGAYTIAAGGGSENASQPTNGFGFGKGGFGGSRPSGETPPAGGGQNADAESSATSASGNPPTPGDKGKPGRGGGGFEAMQPPGKEPWGGAEAEEADTVSTKGIKAGNLTIDGGSFLLDAADDGVHANGDLTLLGGILEIASGDDGIHADGTVTVVSGSVNITSSYEGIEGQHVAIQGGDITLAAADDGLNAAGGTDGSGFGKWGDKFTVSADTPSIVISGGTVRVTAYGDGLDANGTLEIAGGTVTVTGPTSGDTSVLDFDISGTVSGGTFLGTGASSMAQTFSSSKQGVISVSVGSQSAGTEITLTDSTGAVLLSHTPELDFEIVILSAPAMVSGESYTLRVGSITQTFTAK